MPERPQEVQSRAVQELEARGFAKGREEGRKEGREEGRREVLVPSLHLLLKQRFGAVPPALLTRVDEADLALLTRWMGRVVSASRIEDVFAD